MLLPRRILGVHAPAADSLLLLGEEASPRLRGPDAEAALEQLENEYSQLVMALHWFIDHARRDEALRLANALYRFWITKQRPEMAPSGSSGA